MAGVALPPFERACAGVSLSALSIRLALAGRGGFCISFVPQGVRASSVPQRRLYPSHVRKAWQASPCSDASTPERLRGVTVSRSQGVAGVAFARRQRARARGSSSIRLARAGRGKRGRSFAPEKVRQAWLPHPFHTRRARQASHSLGTRRGCAGGGPDRSLCQSHARRVWQASHFLDARRGRTTGGPSLKAVSVRLALARRGGDRLFLRSRGVRGGERGLDSLRTRRARQA